MYLRSFPRSLSLVLSELQSFLSVISHCRTGMHLATYLASLYEPLFNFMTLVFILIRLKAVSIRDI